MREVVKRELVHDLGDVADLVPGRRVAFDVDRKQSADYWRRRETVVGVVLEPVHEGVVLIRGDRHHWPMLVAVGEPERSRQFVEGRWAGLMVWADVRALELLSEQRARAIRARDSYTGA